MVALRSKAMISLGVAALGLGLYALADAPAPPAATVESAPRDFVRLPVTTLDRPPAERVLPTGAPTPAGASSGNVAAVENYVAPVMDPYAG
jgi:hypothetical protein